MRESVDGAVERFGALHVLYNNAGVLWRDRDVSVLETDEDVWDRVFAINLKGMKPGDRCFFYHSNEGKEIVGIAEVAKAAYPDPTDKDGKAVTVDVKAVEPVKTPVTRAYGCTVKYA